MNGTLLSEGLTTRMLNSSLDFDYGPTDDIVRNLFSESTRINISLNGNASESHDNKDDYMNKRFKNVLYCSIVALITAIGLVGNVLMIVIFSVKQYRKMSFSVYLRALAVSDSLVLINTLVDDVITRLFGENILYGNQSICSAYLLWNVFWNYFSAGLLILVALDRYIAVAYPLHRAFLCSYKRAIHITLGTALTCICILLYETVWNEVETHSRGNTNDREYTCPVMYGLVYGIIVTFHAFVFLLLIPFCVVLVLNIRVLYLVKRSLRVKHKPNSLSLARVTLPIITITLSSILLLCPISVVEVVEFVYRWVTVLPELIVRIDTAWDTTNLIKLLNYATNFYVLILFSKKYREKLRSACCCMETSNENMGQTNQASEYTSTYDDNKL